YRRRGSSPPACAGSSYGRSSVVPSGIRLVRQPDPTGNPSMTTQPLTRYGARNGALASDLITTSYTTSRDTTVLPPHPLLPPPPPHAPHPPCHPRESGGPWPSPTHRMAF